MDSFIPWLVIIGGLFIVIAAFRNRFFIANDGAGGRKLGDRSPYGYEGTPYVPPPPPRR
jgi:hypothetical protein